MSVVKTFSRKTPYEEKLVLMNLRTPYDVVCFAFYKNWRSHKEENKDYSFDVFYDFLIRDQHKLLDEGKIGGK